MWQQVELVAKLPALLGETAMMKIIVIALCFVANVSAYPSGAPATACTTLGPVHSGTEPQTTTSPFTITANATYYGNSAAVKVILSGAAQTFNGFILQARHNSTLAAMGLFDTGSLPAGSKSGPCLSGSQQVSVTHSDSSTKNDLEFSWQAPASGAAGDAIFFQGAFAQAHGTYWVNVTSNVVMFEPATTTAAATTTTADSTHTEANAAPAIAAQGCLVTLLILLSMEWL